MNLLSVYKIFSIISKWRQGAVNSDVFFMLNSWRRQKVDGDETLDLKFFPLDDMPPLFCKQHEDCLQDLLEKRVGYIVNIKRS